MPVLSKDPKDLVISENLKLTLSEENFLLFDDGFGTNARMIGFSTQGSLENLLNSSLWFADGTFKHKPEGF